MKKLIFGILGALALFGCGGGSGGGGGDDSSDTRIAFLNASPDTGSLDFLLNDSAKASDVPYGTSTTFGSYKAKDYDLSIRASNDTEVLWSESKLFNADQDYVVMGVGLRTPPSDDTQRLVIKLGSLSRVPVNGNRARLLVINALVRKAGFATPPIDFRGPGENPVVGPDSSNIAFGNSVAIEVDSGAQTFQARQNGTEQVFVERNFNLTPGGVYFALISGLEGENGPSAPEIRLIPITTRK